MLEKIFIDGNHLTLEQIGWVANESAQVVLEPSVVGQLEQIRSQLEQFSQSETPYYGINTGFGALAEKPIPQEALKELQYNLIVSHAVGVGKPLSFAQSKALMLLRTNTLAKGHSGVRPILIETLLTLLNAGFAPYVPSRGSVGASGDLAPLAHLGMLLLGKGKALANKKLIWAKDALGQCGLKPFEFQAKEGLALINGTQAMAALGSLATLDALHLCDLADAIGACTWVALEGKKAPFDIRIHQARPHPGQMESAKYIQSMVEGVLFVTQNSKVQDPYSLRCMPQVHGATRDVVAHIKALVEREINSATDNPLIFFDSTSQTLDILSGGNFHGQPLALGMDYLAMAIAELGNISERRMEQMVNPSLSQGLPPFLAKSPGLQSGFMILQVTAAALVNENKVLSHPASTDSIPTSANREDHVSMGMTSANKLNQIVQNVYTILALELLCACQALDFRNHEIQNSKVGRVYSQVRDSIPFMNCDQPLQKSIRKTIETCKHKASWI